MQDRRYYEVRFFDYPDLVTTAQLREMLGGVTQRTALGILWRGEIKPLRVCNCYRIPKASVIDYLLSDSYPALKKRVDISRHQNGSPEVVENNKKKLIKYCDVPRTRQDLMFLIDVTSKKTFFRLYLRPLLQSGDLRMTIPEQPSISTQRYVRNIQY